MPLIVHEVWARTTLMERRILKDFNWQLIHYEVEKGFIVRLYRVNEEDRDFIEFYDLFLEQIEKGE